MAYTQQANTMLEYFKSHFSNSEYHKVQTQP